MKKSKKIGDGVPCDSDDFRSLLITLYDVMQRNNFSHFPRTKRTEFLIDYIHGYSEAAKIYPEMMGKHENTEINFSKFIHFLEDLSLNDNTRINHWLIPPIYPANGCDNPSIIELNLRTLNDAIQPRELTMSEIQSSAIQPVFSSQKSCRTCVKDRHGPVRKQSEISVLKHSKYRPTTCALRHPTNHVSGFHIHVTTNLRKVHRIQLIKLSKKMKQQFIRLSNSRGLTVVSRLNKKGLLEGTDDVRNDCFVELEFRMKSTSISNTEQVWSKAGYSNIIKKKKSTEEVVTPDEFFVEVRRFLRAIGESCNPIRHSHIGDLFNQNITLPSYGNEFWPPLYVKCNSSIIETIQDVALSRNDDVGEVYQQVPFLLDKELGLEVDKKMYPHVKIAIDPIAFWM